MLLHLKWRSDSDQLDTPTSGITPNNWLITKNGQIARRNVPSNRSLPSEMIWFAFGLNSNLIQIYNVYLPQIMLMFFDDKQFSFICSSFLKVKSDDQYQLRYQMNNLLINLLICFLENSRFICQSTFAAIDILRWTFCCSNGLTTAIRSCFVAVYWWLNQLKNWK